MGAHLEDNLDQKIKEADEKTAAGDHLSAAFFYKDALKIARELGNSEKITYCKQKMVEANQKAIDQMQQSSVEQHVPKEEIDKIIRPILDAGGLTAVLRLIGRHPHLYPNFKNTQASAKSTMPITFQFASLSTFSTEGHLVEGGEDPQFHWLMTMYGMNQGIILQLYLLPIFRELILEKDLDKETLLAYLKNTELFSESSLKILEVGIERYFARDYVSALHILVPQFEAAFLSISEKLGLDIVALNRTPEISTQTKTLSDKHLLSEKFIKAWGEDFCQQLNFILFEPMGYKLRHRIAHGEISSEECNFENTTLILYLFLVLSAMVERRKDDDESAE